MADADVWGCQPGQPPSLARFAVELDQRFLTELAHTTVLFNELFEQSGRKQLIKVAHMHKHTTPTTSLGPSYSMALMVCALRPLHQLAAMLTWGPCKRQSFLAP